MLKRLAIPFLIMMAMVPSVPRAQTVTTVLPTNGQLASVTVDNPGLYYLTVTGTYRWGDGPPERYADAEWMFYDTWQESWSAQGFNLQNDLLDVKINNQFTDWLGLQADGTYAVHAFSPTHTYRQEIWIDSTATVFLYDTDYHDNLGMLNVSAQRVDTVVTPEPASLLLFLAGVLPCGLAFRRRLKA